MAYFKKAKTMSNEDGFEPKEKIQDIEALKAFDVPERGVRKETLEKFGVKVALSPHDGRTPIAVYFPSHNQKGKVVGYMKQDLTKGKDERGHWTAVGSVSIGNKLFGQSVAEKANRKRSNLTITEGQWDCLSVYQAIVDAYKGTKFENVEPLVVSIPMGTANAVEAILHNEPYVLSHDALTIFFDDDHCTPAELRKGVLKGHEAREAVANALVGSSISLFTVTPEDGFKDASDLLQAGRSSDLSKLVQFGRRAYSSEKIVKAVDIDFDDIITPRPEGIYVNCFPKLMEKLHGFRTSELVLLTSPSGVGKCHGKGQEILMSDLTTKKVEDIVVGDVVMGPDGKGRTVLKTHSGVGEIYKVEPKKGLPYTVNSKHLLVVESNSYVPSRGFEKDGRVCISAEDFYKLPKYYKEQVLSGVRANLRGLGDIEQKDAYILGLWLAEGSTAKPQITLARKDTALHEFLLEYAEINGYGVNICPSNNRESSVSYDLSGGFLSRLQEWGVLGNKHIPREFLLANHSSRVALLSGFLDGDGYLHNNGYEVTLKKNKLADDIVMLARTLGLFVKQEDKFCKCQNFEGEYYSRIHIYGATQQLELKLGRKKSNNKPNKNQYRSSIKVTPIGEGEYYGFEVDGDHLYCLPDMQITHNSTVTSIFASAFMESDEKLGMIYLEETNKETVQRLIASKLKVNYLEFKNNPLNVAKREDIERCYKEIVDNDKLVMLSHFGSLPVSELMAKIKHMHLVEGCRFIILDHLSLVISGSMVKDERKELDIVMTELAAFCAANDVCIIAVSHINRTAADQFKAPKVKDGEEPKPYWVQVTKEMMRGSAALEQLSFVILGLEPEIMPDRSRGRVRLTVLKNRPWGYLGVADSFKIDDESWEVILMEDQDQDVSF